MRRRGRATRKPLSRNGKRPMVAQEPEPGKLRRPPEVADGGADVLAVIAEL